jgi:hypothetical protein
VFIVVVVYLVIALVRKLLDTPSYKNFVGKPEGKRPFGRLRRRWQDNIRLDLRERVWEGVDWTHLAQDRDLWRDLVNTVYY